MTRTYSINKSIDRFALPNHRQIGSDRRSLRYRSTSLPCFYPCQLNAHAQAMHGRCSPASWTIHFQIRPESSANRYWCKSDVGAHWTLLQGDSWEMQKRFDRQPLAMPSQFGFLQPAKSKHMASESEGRHLGSSTVPLPMHRIRWKSQGTF